MKAEISGVGILILMPESRTEIFAIREWLGWYSKGDKTPVILEGEYSGTDKLKVFQFSSTMEERNGEGEAEAFYQEALKSKWEKEAPDCGI